MSLDTTIGGAASDSYGTVAEATAYFTARNLTATLWSSLSSTIQEASLRKATQYLDATYMFTGIKATQAQALQWPRYDAELDGYSISNVEIPARVKRAMFELALKATTEELAPDISAQVVTAEAVGPLSVSYTSSPRNGGRDIYDYIESLISPLLSGGGRGNAPLVRA